MADTKKSLAQVPAGSATTESSLLGVDSGAIKRFPITALANLLYPVGSYYWSSDPTDPGTLFGGTWEAVENKFMFAASTSHPVGETGGAESVALSLNQMPAHSHSASTASSGNHSHTGTTNGGGGHGHSASSSAAGYHAHYLAIYRAAGNNPSGSALQFYVQNNPGHGTFNHWSSGDGNHTHDISISYVGDHAHTFTTSYVGDHTHTVMVTSTGGSEAHDNMPPYITAYCWHRTA